MSTYFKIVHKFENVRKTEICSQILKNKEEKTLKEKKSKLEKRRRKTVKPEERGGQKHLEASQPEKRCLPGTACLPSSCEGHPVCFVALTDPTSVK
jgi:hypothetical protein